MKKSFMTRALAMGLSFAMAFSLSAATNVTTASAAAKKASVTSMMKVSSKTVTEGKKVTTYMNSTAAKKYRIKSHTESSVTKKYISVKMTDSRKGLTITAKEGALAAANLEKKGVYVKINFAPAKSVAAVKKAAATKYVKLKVAVVAKEKEEEPEKPVVDTFEMTSLTATKANELTAVFASPVASTSAISIKVNKAGSATAITGTTKWSEDATTVVFTATANFTAGTYEMTATDAADATKTTSKTAEVEAEKVDDIVILNDVALTSADKQTAYIYYEVYNQYGESLKESTSITWTVSSTQTPKVDKAVGKISAERHDGRDYTYGELLYVTGVYSKTGKTVQKQLSIGMEQSLDTVKTVGFVKDTDKSTILTSLPANFQKGQYKLLYQTFDQNENPIDAYDKNITDNNVTFISDNVLLLKNEFNDGPIYTIKGVQYASVTIEPGQYVDKGGEVNITAISNKTGKKSPMNYVIGGTPILKSLVLSQPAEVVADGEQCEIPFVATDIEGNQITNYESIVRTTNTLSLTASDNTSLAVVQKDDGTAKVVWTDTNTDAAGWGSITYDDIDRSIALTTVVVGGESNNLILQVSDKARPVAVESVTLRKDATTAIVENDEDTLDLSRFVFVDQYGRSMDTDAEKAQAIDFFDYSVSSANGWNKAYYGVKVEFNKNASAFTSSQVPSGAAVITGNDNDTNTLSTDSSVDTKVDWKANEISTLDNVSAAVSVSAITVKGSVATESVKYTVASISKADYEKITSASGDNRNLVAADFDYVGKSLNNTYSVVPMKDVTNISINKLNKQYINIGLGGSTTGAEAGIADATMLTADLTSASATIGAINVTVDNGYEQDIKLSGSYNGIAVVVPTIYATFSANKIDFNTTTPSTICTDTVSADALKLGDFFDATKANFVRKDGSDTITASVSKVTTTAALNVYNVVSSAGVTQAEVDNALQQAAPKTTLTFSDALPVPNEVVLKDTCVINPDVTKISSMPTVKVKDQYSVDITDMAGLNWSYNISDVKENTGENAHLDKSFIINGNDTANVTVEGAEIGDTCVIKYTASVNGGSASATTKATIGADQKSRIAYLISTFTDLDQNFRTHYLNYAY